MDDDAPSSRRARRASGDPAPSHDPVSIALREYARAHEPDPARIRARVSHGMRTGASAFPARRADRVHSAAVARRVRFPVPLLVAAVVALLVLGIPLGTSILGPDDVDPAVETSPVTTPSPTGTPSPEATPSPTSPAATPTKTAKPTRTTTKPASSARPGSTSAPSGQTNRPAAWPGADGEAQLSATRTVSGTFDGGLKRFNGTGELGGDPDSGDLPPLFKLEDGATIKNVIIGARSGDGIHCLGTCRIENVWWEDVGDDAATLKADSSSAVMTVVGGGARHADNSIFGSNGKGTVVIRGWFQAEDFNKLYRSCGNCRVQAARHVVVDGVHLTAPGSIVVGINTNLGDTAALSRVVIHADSDRRMTVCQWYEGVPSGKESRKVGEGPSGACRYEQSDVTYSR